MTPIIRFISHVCCQLLLVCGWYGYACAQPVDTTTRIDTAALPAVLMSFDSNHPGATGSRVVATATMMGTNVLPYLVNRYIRKEKFAYLTWQSLYNNLRLRNWKWDQDAFINNQFSHPYHGSLYFNAFRSEGFSFWQSVPSAFTGSFIWELAAEQETPAINGLVNTTLGGIAWGEMTHRLANKFLRARRRGKKLKGLQVLGKMVDPMSSFSNWVNPGKRALRSKVDTTKIHFLWQGGSRQYNQAYDGHKLWPRGEWFTRLNLQYGGGAERLKTPYSQFSVMVELGTSDSTFFNIAQIRGNLTGWKWHQSARSLHYSTINLDYDYYRNTAFMYGMQSIQGTFFSRYAFRPAIALQTEFGLSAVGLAAISDYKPFDGRARAYDYASGGGFSAGLHLLLLDQFGFRTANRIRWLATLDGKLSNYRVINSSSSIYYQWKKKIQLSYEWGHFFLKSHIDNDLPQKSHNFYKRVAVGYRFSL